MTDEKLRWLVQQFDYRALQQGGPWRQAAQDMRYIQHCSNPKRALHNLKHWAYVFARLYANLAKSPEAELSPALYRSWADGYKEMAFLLRDALREAEHAA